MEATKYKVTMGAEQPPPYSLVPYCDSRGPPPQYSWIEPSAPPLPQERIIGHYFIPDLEVPVTGAITAVIADNFSSSGNTKTLVYVQTDTKRPDSAITCFDLKGNQLALFGTGSGGMLMDTHPRRQCVCMAQGGTLHRRMRGGQEIPTGLRHVPIDDVSKIVSMATIGDGEKVKYACASVDKKCVLVIGAYGKVTEIKNKTDSDFQPRNLATPTSRGDLIAASGVGDNKIRLYQKKNGKWKLGKMVGCQGHGKDKLRQPKGLAFDLQGRLLVSDTDKVVRLTKLDDGEWWGQVLLSQENLGQKKPIHLSVSNSGQLVLAVQSYDNKHSFLVFKDYWKM